jgi:hypothetical protein
MEGSLSITYRPTNLFDTWLYMTYHGLLVRISRWCDCKYNIVFTSNGITKFGKTIRRDSANIGNTSRLLGNIVKGQVIFSDIKWHVLSCCGLLLDFIIHFSSVSIHNVSLQVNLVLFISRSIRSRANNKQYWFTGRLALCVLTDKKVGYTQWHDVKKIP